MFYLGDDATSLLNAGDYGINPDESMFMIGLYDYEPDISTSKYKEVMRGKAEMDPVYLEVETAPGSWQNMGEMSVGSCGNGSTSLGVYNLCTMNAPDADYPENIMGVRMHVESNAYRVRAYILPAVTLYPTDTVVDYITSADYDYSRNVTIPVWDINTVSIKDDDGNVIGMEGSTIGGAIKSAVDERDQINYGRSMYHSKTDVNLTGQDAYDTLTIGSGSTTLIDSGATVRNTHSIKLDDSMLFANTEGNNDKLEGVKKKVMKGLPVDGVDDEVVTLHYLAPAGWSASFSAKNGTVIVGEVASTLNYKDSGRTMYEISVRRASDTVYSLGVDVALTMPVNDYVDYGYSESSPVAYVSATIPNEWAEPDPTDSYKLGQTQSRDDASGTKWPDDYKTVMTGIHDGDDLAVDLYQQATIARKSVTTSAVYGLSKSVSVDGSTWSSGANTDLVVNQGGTYSYRLRLGTEQNSQTKNVILYDSLENYVGPSVGSDVGRWRGSLQSVNTGALQARGVNAVVYYSTVKDLDLEGDPQSNPDAPGVKNRDLSNTDIWSTKAPDDMSKVTAVAVDCSKKTDGTDMVWEPGTGIVVLLYMTAPEDESGVLADAGLKAYNGVIDTSTLISLADQRETGHYNSWGYTEIGLPEPPITLLDFLPGTGGRSSYVPLIVGGAGVLMVMGILISLLSRRKA